MKKVEYYLEARFAPDTDGGYTAYVPTLSGAESHGETLEEAIEMIQDAVESLMRAYHYHKMDVPFKESTSGPEDGELSKYLYVEFFVPNL